MRSKILKTIGIFFLVLVLLIVAISVFLRTEYFRKTIKGVVERSVSDVTGQTFTIGKIEGSFISGIRLEGVSLKVEGEPFIYLEEFLIKYSLPLILDSSMLFSKSVPIDKVSFRGLNVNLVQYEDGSWNFNKLGKDKEEKEKKKEKEQREPPDWSILIGDLLLKDAKVRVENRKKGEVTEIKIPELDSSLKMFDITRRVEFNLDSGDVFVSPNQISIKGLSTKAVYTEDTAEIKSLEANVNGTKIRFSGEVKGFKEPEFKFEAAAYGFNIEEGVLNAEIDGEGRYISPENIQAEIEIRVPDSKILGKKVSGSVENIKMSGTKVEVNNGKVRSELGEILFEGNAELDRLLTKGGVNEFNFDLSLKDVEVIKILGLLKDEIKDQPNIPENANLNANFNVYGSWKDVEDLKANVNIAKFHLEGEKAGEVDINGRVEVTKSDVGFDLASQLNNFNLSPILNDKKYASNLNLNLQLEGSVPLKGDLLNSLTTTVQGKVLPSNFSGINLAGGEINASYADETLNVKSLSLTSNDFTLEAEGTRGEKKGMDFRYDVEVKNLSFISKFLPELDLEGSLDAEGRVRGEIKKPQVTLSAKISNFEYKEDFKVRSANLNGEGAVDLENPRFQVEGVLNGVEIQDRNIQTVNLQAKSEGEGIRGNISVLEDAQRSYEAQIKVADLKGEEKNLTIENIEFNLEDKVIKNRDDINLTIYPNRLVVESLNLYFRDNYVLGNADVGFDGNIDANLEIKQLNLTDVSQVLELEPPVQGITSGTISLQGTMEEPQISADINAQNLEFKEFKSDSLNLDLSYLNSKLDLNLGVTENARQILRVSGGANVDLNFKQLRENLKNATFDLTVQSSGLDLSPVSKLSEEIKSIDGKAVIDLRASGSVERPSLNGQVRLENVSLSIQVLKDELKITNALIEMRGESGFLRTLEIRSNGGRGRLEGDFNLRELSYNLSGRMDDFEVELEQVTAKVDGDLDLKGSGGKISITGDIESERTRIRIPEGRRKEVEEIKFVDEGEEVEGVEEEFVIKEAKETDYFRENVAMDLKVSAPRNAWVRGRGANIEVGGKVRVIKEYGEPLIITGSINTIRGGYEFFGKLFKIEEGTVSFQGTPEINPFLDVTALYEVSDVDIFVNIGGTVKEPKINLTSDPAMEETDIFSYLAFGTSSDKIGAGARVSLEARAAQALGNMAAGQLEEILGDEFALDVIRIGAAEGGPQLEVGKYLTDELYVAYERGPTESVDTTAAPIITNKFRVEYSPFDFLTFESDVGGEQAGGDVFFKFDYSCPLLQ